MCGWALGFALIAVSAFGATLSNLIIAKIAIKHKLKNYSDIARTVGGKRLGDTLSVLIIVYLLGAVISYQIILSSLISYVCVTFGMSQDFGDSIGFRAILGAPLAIFIFIPMSLLRDMSSF